MIQVRLANYSGRTVSPSIAPSVTTNGRQVLRSWRTSNFCFTEPRRLGVSLLGVDRIGSPFAQVSMTKEEYEREYRAAISSVEQRGHRVGSPYVSHHGVRSVRIDNFAWTDDVVFEEAWGKEQAIAIAAERPTLR